MEIWQILLPVLSLLVSVSSLALAYSVSRANRSNKYIDQLNKHETDIAVLKTQFDNIDDKLDDIKDLL